MKKRSILALSTVLVLCIVMMLVLASCGATWGEFEYFGFSEFYNTSYAPGADGFKNSKEITFPEGYEFDRTYTEGIISLSQYVEESGSTKTHLYNVDTGKVFMTVADGETLSNVSWDGPICIVTTRETDTFDSKTYLYDKLGKLIADIGDDGDFYVNYDNTLMNCNGKIYGIDEDGTVSEICDEIDILGLSIYNFTAIGDYYLSSNREYYAKCYDKNLKLVSTLEMPDGIDDASIYVLPDSKILVQTYTYVDVLEKDYDILEDGVLKIDYSQYIFDLATGKMKEIELIGYIMDVSNSIETSDHYAIFNEENVPCAIKLANVSEGILDEDSARWFAFSGDGKVGKCQPDIFGGKGYDVIGSNYGYFVAKTSDDADTALVDSDGEIVRYAKGSGDVGSICSYGAKIGNKIYNEELTEILLNLDAEGITTLLSNENVIVFREMTETDNGNGGTVLSTKYYEFTASGKKEITAPEGYEISGAYSLNYSGIYVEDLTGYVIRMRNTETYEYSERYVIDGKAYDFTQVDRVIESVDGNVLLIMGRNGENEEIILKLSK